MVSLHGWLGKSGSVDKSADIMDKQSTVEYSTVWIWIEVPVMQINHINIHTNVLNTHREYYLALIVSRFVLAHRSRLVCKFETYINIVKETGGG